MTGLERKLYDALILFREAFALDGSKAALSDAFTKTHEAARLGTETLRANVKKEVKQPQNKNVLVEKNPIFKGSACKWSNPFQDGIKFDDIRNVGKIDSGLPDD